MENAEHLSFDDRAFDIVYSLGVLHHTPEPKLAFDEVHRVLKPNGKAIIMLYHKNSFNYYFRIMLYMRARVLIKIFSRIGNWKADRAGVGNNLLVGLRGNQSKKIWDIHYKNFLTKGWGYLKANNFVNHCTDGPECPLAKVFTKSDIRKAFSEFKDVDVKSNILSSTKVPVGKWIPFGVERFLAARLGWNLLIIAIK